MTKIIHVSFEIFSGAVTESTLVRHDVVSVGNQFLMFQRIVLPSSSSVQKAVISCFQITEPETQRHIPQELRLFGESSVILRTLYKTET
jgi:hypothetical protein